MSEIWEEQDYQEILAFVEKQLWLLVQENAHIHKPRQVVCNFAQLSYSELRLLQTIYFLLSPPVQKLIQEDTPYILRHLPHSSARITSEFRGMVRGNVDWTKTLRRRNAGGNDPTVFVSRVTMKTNEVPEVQALKFLLIQVSRLSAEVLDSLPEKISTSNQPKGKWKENIRSLNSSCKFFLRNIYLRDIKPQKRIGGLWLQRVRCARATHFTTLFQSLMLYQKLFVMESQEALRDCVTKGVLEPLDRDTLYELYILFLTNESIEREGWTRERIRLIGYGNGAVAHYKFGDQFLKVYYQALPMVFTQKSLYTRLLRKYGLDVNRRRPDILLEFEKDTSRFTLVEIKRTQDRDYIVESAYKVLGYLKDFEKCFESSSVPHAVLVVWELKNSAMPLNDILVLVDHRTYQEYLKHSRIFEVPVNE